MLYACRDFPFTEVQLCKLAYQIAVSEKKTGFSPIKKRAGRSWLKYFYKRQPDLKKKVASNLSIGRAMAANPGCIEKFFEEYSEEKDKEHMEDDEKEEEDEEDDEEEDEELEEMIRVSIVQAGKEGDVHSSR